MASRSSSQERATSGGTPPQGKLARLAAGAGAESAVAEPTEEFHEIPLPDDTPTPRGGAAPAALAEEKGVAAGPQRRRGEVIIDGDVYHVAEGDLLLDPDEHEIYQQQQQALAAQQDAFQSSAKAGYAEASIIPELFGGALPGNKGYLVGMMQDGKLVRWAPGTILSYCVLRETFPRQEWYEEVVDNMQEATAAWEEVCGVKFQYVPDHDNSSDLRPRGVLFPVRHISANGAFIASSFFPNDPASRRRVLIDPSYFTTRFDHVGVLRHELGHVLGFRHEHIRSGAPPVCPDESTVGTIDLTAYDPSSCMHYFCGGVGSRDLAITEVDRVGAQRVYGPPLNTFQYVET
jgi:hypothetical protein